MVFLNVGERLMKLYSVTKSSPTLLCRSDIVWPHSISIGTRILEKVGKHLGKNHPKVCSQTVFGCSKWTAVQTSSAEANACHVESLGLSFYQSFNAFRS